MERVILCELPAPQKDCTGTPVILSAAAMQQRKAKVLERMAAKNLDSIIVYADLEHGGNFEYLVGFVPRFEEALLVLHSDGKAWLLLGNENLNKAQYARIEAEAIHVPHFSLPNQPMQGGADLKTIIGKAGLRPDSKIGLAGWKLFTCKCKDADKLFDVPTFIVDAIKSVVGETSLCNATDVFIGKNGARLTCDADEIAHYEFGASLASDCILDAMGAVRVGISEMELGDKLNRYGQRNSVVTIASTGERFEDGYLYPKDKKSVLGDRMSLTVGYKGGLSSRAGYVAASEKELPQGEQDYIDVLVKPYFNAICTWLENVKCGMTGGEVYNLVEAVLPKSRYNWYLCPGHLVADEEWLSSPIYEESQDILESGMIFQTDIIPTVAGYSNVSAESTVCLADVDLRNKIKNENPALWARIQTRRDYIRTTLNINLSPDILPMCSTVAYLRPYLLAYDKAMKLVDK